MNKLFLTLLVFLLTCVSFAQTSDVQRGRMPSPKVFHKKPAVSPSINQAKTVIWESSFSNSQDWQIGNSAGNAANWEISNAPSYWWSSNAPLASTSGGYAASFNSDAYALAANQTQNNAWIQSTPFSCSNFATVAVTFQQFFNKWTGRTFIQVSNNNGQTWVDYEVNASMSNNEETSNPQVTMVDITQTAAYQQEVIIRFLYLSNAISDGGTDNTAGEAWDYGWIVDDVQVAELPDNDIAITKAWHANVFWDYEYSRVPLTQTRELIPCAIVSNQGALQQTIDVTATITDASGIVNSTTQSVTVAYGAKDTIWFNSGYTPDAIGEYNVNFTIPADQDPSDDEMDASPLYISNNIMAHDFGDNNMAFGWNPFSSDSAVVALANEPHSWGNIYHPENDELIYGVDVKFALGTSPGLALVAHVYRFDSLGGIQGNLQLVTEKYYEVQPSDINSSFTTIVFPQPVMLISGSGYIIDIMKIDGTQDQGFFIGGSDIATEDDDYSTVAYGPYGQNGTVNYYRNWGFAPYVRANFNAVLGLEESTSNNISIFPNPSSGIINVQNVGKIPSEVIVSNLEGRKILTTTIQSAKTLDLSSYSSGVYLVTISNSKGSITKRIVLE